MTVSEAYIEVRKGVMKRCVFQEFRGLGGEMGNREEKNLFSNYITANALAVLIRRSETQQLKLS